MALVQKHPMKVARNFDEDDNFDDICDISGHRLENLPVDLGMPKNFIKSLYMQDNMLKKLPDDFFDHLSDLVYCDVRNNQLKYLPEIKEKSCAKLKTLLIQNNSMSCLNYTLGNAQSLKTLGLSGNPIYDPPQDILKLGCTEILHYLKEKLDSNVNLETLVSPRSTKSNLDFYEKTDSAADISENDDPPAAPTKGNTPRGLSTSQHSILKSFAKRSAGQLQLKSRSVSSFSSKSENILDKKQIAKIQYSWDLWRDIPYEGQSQQSLVQNCLKIAQKEGEKNFNMQIDKVLQRFKNKESLKKWRDEARKLQRTSRKKEIPKIDPPFGTEKDSVNSKSRNDLKLSPEKFQKEFTGCLLKLRKFRVESANISNTREAFDQLQEVMQVQKKLSSLKMMNPFGSNL